MTHALACCRRSIQREAERQGTRATRWKEKHADAVRPGCLCARRRSRVLGAASRRPKEQRSNHEAEGQAVWVKVREWVESRDAELRQASEIYGRGLTSPPRMEHPLLGLGDGRISVSSLACARSSSSPARDLSRPRPRTTERDLDEQPGSDPTMPPSFVWTRGAVRSAPCPDRPSSVPLGGSNRPGLDSELRGRDTSHVDPSAVTASTVDVGEVVGIASDGADLWVARELVPRRRLSPTERPGKSPVAMARFAP